MLLQISQIGRLTGIRLCVGCVLLCTQPAASAPPMARPHDAYYDGKRIMLKPAAIRRAQKLVFGGVVLGPVVAGRKPHDRRLNLYVVSPGTQHGRSPSKFNLIVNDIPQTDRPVDLDVYWAFALDPALEPNYRSERELLVAAQDGFLPDSSFSFESIPAADHIRKHLHIDTLDGLESFRREDGKLPRIIIVPARSAIRASVDPGRVGSTGKRTKRK